MICFRPHYSVIRPEAALRQDWRGYHLSEKMDGCWHELRIGQSLVVGELMADGRFFAFDLPFAFGRDLRRLPWTERSKALDGFRLLRPATPRPGESGADFLQRILASGGEGIVAKPLDCGLGIAWFKCKRRETHDCLVLEKHPAKMSLHLADERTGEERGWCACLFSHFDGVQAGDVVEVEAYGLTAKGRFREPRFVRVRMDKAGV